MSTTISVAEMCPTVEAKYRKFVIAMADGATPIEAEIIAVIQPTSRGLADLQADVDKIRDRRRYLAELAQVDGLDSEYKAAVEKAHSIGAEKERFAAESQKAFAAANESLGRMILAQSAASALQMQAHAIRRTAGVAFKQSHDPKLQAEYDQVAPGPTFSGGHIADWRDQRRAEAECKLWRKQLDALKLDPSAIPLQPGGESRWYNRRHGKSFAPRDITAMGGADRAERNCPFS